MACKRIYRKTPYLMGKTMVFSFRLRFSLTWTNPMNFRIWVHVSTVLERCDVWPLELPSGSGGSMEVTEENRAIFEAGAARTWMRCMGLIERVVWPTWWHMDMLWQFQWGKKNPLDHWILMDLGDNKSSRLDQGGEIIQCQWVVGSLRVESLRLQSPKRNRSRLTSSGFFFVKIIPCCSQCSNNGSGPRIPYGQLLSSWLPGWSGDPDLIPPRFFTDLLLIFYVPNGKSTTEGIGYSFFCGVPAPHGNEVQARTNQGPVVLHPASRSPFGRRVGRRALEGGGVLSHESVSLGDLVPKALGNGYLTQVLGGHDEFVADGIFGEKPWMGWIISTSVQRHYIDMMAMYFCHLGRLGLSTNTGNFT